MKSKSLCSALNRRTLFASLAAHVFFIFVLVGSLTACASSFASSRGPEYFNELDAIANELEAMSQGYLGEHKETFRSILQDTLDKDSYLCTPLPSIVFGAGVLPGGRTVQGEMPHYGLYYGPMHYRIQRSASGWTVSVRLALVPPRASASELELPDCNLKEWMNQSMQCSGIPYSRSGSIDACPASGQFKTALTPQSIKALLLRWSAEAERYFNRDAEQFHLNVRYDFDFVTEEEAKSKGLQVDMTLPLSPTCGRTPYFSSFRSGWSIPIVAHEVGHFMGLLDEYEMFSGVVGFYPKTPFKGAEISRMGFSMKEHTKVLPLHHYLILRRYFCDPRRETNPYRHVP